SRLPAPPVTNLGRAVRPRAVYQKALSGTPNPQSCALRRARPLSPPPRGKRYCCDPYCYTLPRRRHKTPHAAYCTSCSDRTNCPADYSGRSQSSYQAEDAAVMQLEAETVSGLVPRRHRPISQALSAKLATSEAADRALLVLAPRAISIGNAPRSNS